MTERRFAQVDVFGTGGLSGNPLAVVVDASGLATEQMAAFARWTNLSETTFLLPPTQTGADYAVRIFTLTGELPFAGHPTLGTAATWLAQGGVPRRPGVVVQECGAGLVPVRVDGDVLSFAAPARRRTGPLDADTLTAAERCLGVPRSEFVAHEWGDNGPPWAMVQLASGEAVRALRPRLAELGRVFLGVVGLYDRGPFACEVRGLLANFEDPVTGSLNAAVAQWLRGRDLVPSSYRAAQGASVGRAGEVVVTDDGRDIWIGGRVQPVIAGTVVL